MFQNKLDASQKIWISKEVGEWMIGYLNMGIRRWEKSIDCSKCTCIWWRRFLDPQGWRQSLEQIQFGHGKVCFNKLGTQRISLFTALKNTSSYSIRFYRHLLEAGSWGYGKGDYLLDLVSRSCAKAGVTFCPSLPYAAVWSNTCGFGISNQGPITRAGLYWRVRKEAHYGKPPSALRPLLPSLSSLRPLMTCLEVDRAWKLSKICCFMWLSEKALFCLLWVIVPFLFLYHLVPLISQLQRAASFHSSVGRKECNKYVNEEINSKQQ